MIIQANNYDDYMNSLEHYGVQGMRWGVRKARPTSSSSSSHKTARSTKLAEKAKAQAQKEKLVAVKSKRLSDVRNASTLTTKQLQDKVNRLQLEKQLRTLTKSEVAPGRAAVAEVLSNAGKQTAQQLLVKYGVKYGEKGIDAMINAAVKAAAKKAAG